MLLVANLKRLFDFCKLKFETCWDQTFAHTTSMKKPEHKKLSRISWHWQSNHPMIMARTIIWGTTANAKRPIGKFGPNPKKRNRLAQPHDQFDIVSKETQLNLNQIQRN